MLTKILKYLNNNDSAQVLAKLLAEPANQEELLGMRKVVYPTPEKIRRDASQIARYSDSEDYKRWAAEAWGRVIDGLDKVLDANSNHETRQYYCGVVRATLDLLRVSYIAKDVVTSQPEQQGTLHPK